MKNLNKIKTIFVVYFSAVFFFLIYGCTAKPSNELEDMSKDVLKAKQGIEIQIQPMAK
jgi:hypothetical protein